MTAFILRVLSILTRRNGTPGGGGGLGFDAGISEVILDAGLGSTVVAPNYHYLSFQVLSFVSPFIW